MVFVHIIATLLSIKATTVRCATTQLVMIQTHTHTHTQHILNHNFSHYFRLSIYPGGILNNMKHNMKTRKLWTQKRYFTLKVRSRMCGADAGRKLASTQNITCVHSYVVAERTRSRSKIRSATNGSNTQFSASASKPHAPNHLRPQEMADLPASAPRMCQHTRRSGAGMSKSARPRSTTAPRICECCFTGDLWGVFSKIFGEKLSWDI